MAFDYDVLVVDLFGKVRDGTFVGDNLSTSIRKRTKAGAVIHGGIRDFAGVSELTDVAFFCRGLDPSAIANVTLSGVNGPVRIGNATVLPGDVVLGRNGAVIFIPPHLAEQVVKTSEVVRLRDMFGHQRLREGKYTAGQIDARWSEAIAIYERGLEQDNLAEEFYRGVMRCHLAQGDAAAALRAYRRCRELLSIVLGVQPSPQTQALYQSGSE